MVSKQACRDLRFCFRKDGKLRAFVSSNHRQMHKAVRKPSAFRNEAQQALARFQLAGFEEVFHDEIDRGGADIAGGVAEAFIAPDPH